MRERCFELLGADGDGEPLAALAPPPTDNGSTGLGLHSSTEAVGALSSDAARLVGSLHAGGSNRQAEVQAECPMRWHGSGESVPRSARRYRAHLLAVKETRGSEGESAVSTRFRGDLKQGFSSSSGKIPPDGGSTSRRITRQSDGGKPQDSHGVATGSSDIGRYYSYYCSINTQQRMRA